MFAIIGAGGKVGYSTSLALRVAGVPVRAILRDEIQARRLSAIGCDIALADIRDRAALGQAIANVQAVQVILPPQLQAEDAAGEMRQSIESLAAALTQGRAKRVLAISDYGAHIREDIGMPTLFHTFEQRLRQLEMPKVFLRSAEHMEGWAALVRVALATGSLPSMHHPVEKPFHTVSALDVGRIAADMLLHPKAGGDEQIVHVEGPRLYSATDVADALSQLLGRPISALAVPRSQWQGRLERAMSGTAAKLLIALYDAHNEGGIIGVEPDGRVRYGNTVLLNALRPFVLSTLKGH